MRWKEVWVVMRRGVDARDEEMCACLGGSHRLAGRQSQGHFVPEKGGPVGGR